MKRRDFLKKLAVSTGAAIVTPALIAKPKECDYLTTQVTDNTVPENYGIDQRGLITPQSGLSDTSGFFPESYSIQPGETPDGRHPKIVDSLDRGYRPGPFEIVSANQVSAGRFPTPNLFSNPNRYAQTPGNRSVLLYRGDEFQRQFAPLNDTGLALLKKKDMEGQMNPLFIGGAKKPDNRLFEQIKRMSVTDRPVQIGSSPGKAETGDVIVYRHDFGDNVFGIGALELQQPMDLNVRKFNEFSSKNEPISLKDVEPVRANYFQPVKGTFFEPIVNLENKCA